MKSFLCQVANHYISTPGLERYCFVFPSRRACTFFSHELQNATGKQALLMPQVITMVDFASQLVKAIPVAPIEALFTLYDCYRSLSGNEDYEFDKFVRWGNIILSDFNDVDMALVDPKQIFYNVKEFREIATDYLDDELKDILNKYFNAKFNVSTNDADDDDPPFWLHIQQSDDDTEVKKNYLHLWQQLFELYSAYNRSLAERGLTYMGKIYRDAVQMLRDTAPDQLPWQRIVMVGFNMLTNAELVMFNTLDKKGVVDFFWDNAGPIFTHDAKYGGNQGAQFINSYAKMFPMPHDFILEQVNSTPQIEILAVPSNVGQAKVAFNALDDTDDTSLNTPHTAIVLPDEALFLPLLNSVPERVEALNVTMGYSMKYSDIASLLRIIALSHRRARHCRDNNTEWEFYREDVKDLLSHPIIKRHFSLEALNIVALIDNNKLYYVPQSIFNGTPFKTLFIMLDENASTSDVINYLNCLVDFIKGITTKITSEPNDDEDVDDEDDKSDNADTMPLQVAFYRKMNEALDYIQAAISRHEVNISGSSIFFLIERLTSGMVVPLEGEPLQGLQVMGMIETRCLDFDRLVILSVNERILPGRYRLQSFISEGLRHVFNLPTAVRQEAMWSYHFYRLLSRANKVTLIYDARRSQRVGSNEPSRFIEQLRLIYSQPLNIKMSKQHYISQPSISSTRTLQIAKGEYAKKVLDSYCDPENGLALSASSINKYIDCPLKFYLQYIEQLGDEERTGDFMQATTFGDIVHETLQELYYPDTATGVARTGSYRVTGADIKAFRTKKVDGIIKKLINKKYLFRDCNNLNAQLTGEALIQSESIKTYVNRVLDYDYKLIESDCGFIDILECEKTHVVQFPLSDGRWFNFKFKADRIDRVNGSDTIRIVDYKTGSDDTFFKSVQTLFDNKEKKRPHAALQLLLYCHAYAKATNFNGAIMPMIYKTQDIDTSGLGIGSKVENKKQIDDYRDVDDFMKVFTDTMDNFFNPDVPFIQYPINDDDDNNNSFNFIPCDYCPFTDICCR